MSEMKNKSLENIIKKVFNLKDEKSFRLCVLITFLIYLIDLTRKIILYCGLLKDYLTKKPMQGMLSYFDVLENNYAPPVSAVIVSSVYLAAFLSVIILFAALLKRNKRIVSFLTCLILFIAGAIIFTGYFISDIHRILLIGIAAALFYMGYTGYKRKINVWAYSAVIVLMLIENIVFSAVSEPSVLDTVVFILLSVCGANMESAEGGADKA